MPLMSMNQNTRLQDIYNRFDDPNKVAQIKQGKTALLTHLGDAAKNTVWIRYSLFRYLDDNTQATYMSELANFLGGAQLDMLLGSTDTSTQRQALFDNWAKKNGKYSAEERIAFATGKIETRYLNEYKKGLKYQIRNDKLYGIGKSRKSSRLKPLK